MGIAEKSKTLFRILFVLLVNLLLVLALIRMNPTAGNPDKPTLSDDYSTIPPDTRRVAYFGVLAITNPRSTFESFQPVMDFLTASTAYRFELKLGSSYQEIIEDLRMGSIDVAYLGPLAYVKAHEEFGARCFLRARNSNGLGHYHSVVVVREDSDLNFLSDLKGVRFAFSDLMSTSGNLIPRYMLANAGIHLKDLAGYGNLEHHDSVIREVLIGKYDAGAVMLDIADQYKDQGIRVIAKSRPLPSYVIATSPSADDQFVMQITNAFLSVDTEDTSASSSARAWPPGFRHGFMPATHKAYEHIQKMFDDIPQGCGLNCHPSSR